jgi:hypothetical protein
MAFVLSAPSVPTLIYDVRRQHSASKDAQRKFQSLPRRMSLNPRRNCFVMRWTGVIPADPDCSLAILGGHAANLAALLTDLVR